MPAHSSDAAPKRRSILNPGELGQRLRWRGTRAKLGTTDEPATIATLLACLFVFGSLLLLVTIALPGSAERDTTGMAVIAGFGVLTGALYIAAYERTPIWALKAGPAIGAVLIAAVVYFAGSTAAASYGISLVGVVIASAAFSSARLTVAHVLFALLTYGAAMIAAPGDAQLIPLKLAMAAGTLALVGLVMSALTTQLRDVLHRLADAALTDPLTGLLNRRALNEGFDTELARSRRNRNAVALIVIDLDHFKRFNDERGHPAGDNILRRLANVLQETTRGVDQTARIGGEEFAVMAPETGIPGGLALAERLRRAIEIEFAGESPTLTASLGIAGSPGNGSDRPQLMMAADEALYAAKQSGRNRAVPSAAKPPEATPERRVSDPAG